MDKVISTVVGVVVAIGVSAALFIGANVLFDQAPRRWKAFNALIGGAATALVFTLLWGNRLIDNGIIWIPVALVGGAAVGWMLGSAEDPVQRLTLGVVGGGGLGVLAGVLLNETVTVGQGLNNPDIDVGTFPGFDPLFLVLWVAIGIAVAAGFWVLRRRRGSLVRSIALWGTIGWIFGAWLASDIGAGSRVEAIVATTVIGVGMGAWVGLGKNPTVSARDELSRNSRKYIFLGPALIFIALSLVVPTLRTIYLSFLGTRGREFVGMRNYANTFNDPTIVELSGWSGIFGSKLFWAGLILLVVGLVVARMLGKQTGHRMDLSGGTVPPIAVGIFLLVFAVMANLRGTIFNNLWWVFTVTVVATSLGLAIAVLADRARFESVAKSIIFLPMAISFVGAAIIWRFMYIARPPNRAQTGVMNSIWAGLGQLSESGLPKIIVSVVLALIIAGLGYLAWRGWKGGARGVFAGSLVTVLPFAFLLYRLLGPGLGGLPVGKDGSTILFLQETPFNNVWIMVVLIWIQTGFAMVIFSAAIKGVPNDLLEAAKVDGATESQTFWRVVIPQIATTIGVVVTTLIVLVMKVFDIVKVMTNGNFDTQVLANEMWQRAFTEFNLGLGSALAVVLFVSVLPIMYINIRRMQKAAA